MPKKYTVDKTKPVLVTGATGYVAGPLIRELLEEGVTVHATVRDPSKKEKFKYLQDIADKSPGTIKFFKADLIDGGSFADAMKGCSVVFHTASPFPVESKDPVPDLIEPAVHGTENVLRTASETPTVKKVVLTSSVAAALTDISETYYMHGGVVTEEAWNRTASLDYMPYCLSKTLAEQKAWMMAGSQTQWKLVVINPAFILGPGATYHPSSTSMHLIKQAGDGTMAKGCPGLAFGVVDVRDVAKAHVAAAYIEEAQGRHLLVGHNSSLVEITEILRKKYYPEYPLPTRKVPTLLLWLIGPFLPVGALPRKFIWNNFDVVANFDNTKAKTELGIDFTPLEQTLHEMFQQMIDEGVFKKE